MRYVLVKLSITVCFHICCGVARDAALPESPASDTAIVLQQDRDARVSFVKSPSNSWQRTVKVDVRRAPAAAQSRAILGASAVVISSPPPAPAGPLFALQSEELSHDEIFTSTLDDPTSRLRSVELQAGGSGSSNGLRQLQIAAGQQRSIELSSLGYESLPLRPPPSSVVVNWAGPNISMATGHSGSMNEDATPHQPALYAVIAAIVASCGYMGLVAVRCVGLLQEFSPKTPLSDFVAAPRKPSFGNAEATIFSRARRTRPATRLCCPSREVARLAAAGHAAGSDDLVAGKPAPKVSSHPDELSGESSPI